MDVIYVAPLARNIEGSNDLMVLQVRSTPACLPTSILYTPVDSTPLFFYTNFVLPLGQADVDLEASVPAPLKDLYSVLWHRVCRIWVASIFGSATPILLGGHNG